jgi:hypothetical protein
LLEKVQRRAVNMASGLKGTTYEEKLNELDMLTLEERRHQSDMVQVYKTLHGYDRVDKSQWFRLAAGNEMRTRLATGIMNPAKPRFNTDMRRTSLRCKLRRVGKHSVPDKIKKVKNTWQFKQLYRSFRCSRTRH